MLHPALPQLGRRRPLASTEVLDAWRDDRDRRIVLYGLATPYRGRGFVARATDRSGRLVAERYFIETDEGLEATGLSSARRLLHPTRPRLLRMRWLWKRRPAESRRGQADPT